MNSQNGTSGQDTDSKIEFYKLEYEQLYEQTRHLDRLVWQCNVVFVGFIVAIITIIASIQNDTAIKIYVKPLLFVGYILLIIWFIEVILYRNHALKHWKRIDKIDTEIFHIRDKKRKITFFHFKSTILYQLILIILLLVLLSILAKSIN